MLVFGSFRRMNTLRKIITTMLLALPLASPLAAQDLASICKSIGELSIGQWVQFQADAPIVKTLNGRIAIVGEKTVDGSRNFWLEFNIVNPVGNTIMQLLIPSYPYPAEAVSGMIMQLAPDLVMEYPKEMASSMSGQQRDKSQAVMSDSNPGVDMLGLTFSYHFGADQQLVSAVQDEQK